ncbi:MAG: NUDIX domain-containing protein [Clostridiales bacterium]|nr:NUDIX domain-containing protein [Clostridiales bacterium]
MSNYRLSARGIIIKDGKILLNEFGDGLYFNIIGGGVEPEEDLRSAVKREVLEESGYTVVSKKLLYIYEYNPIRDNFSYGERGGLSHVFLCEIDESIKRQSPSVLDYNPDNPEIKSTGGTWVEIENLHNIKLVPRIAHIIQEDYKNNNFSTKFLEDIH